jgi:aryl-alcohol dehydrogenase-like predicted oxidoreductase
MRGEMLYRKLGSTGVEVSAIGMGGYHLGATSLSDAEAIRLMHEAIDRGLTFMDNSWDYNQGQSEIRMGKALAQGGYRQKVFLMTKLDGRTKETATSQIDESLKRLQTDHIDLIQHHEILRYDDPDRIFGPSGAQEAMLEARKAGKVRFIGFTGHKDPHVHLYMLDVAARHNFHFDTAQMPLNVMDAHFRSFAQLVVPRLVREKIGVLSMKPFGGGDGIILKSNTVQPLDCLHYAMNLPTSVVITGIDKQQALDQAFQAAKTFQLMDQQQVAAILQKTEQAARNGEYELFKTSAHFDSTAKHPDWLGGESPEVQKLAPPNAG